MYNSQLNLIKKFFLIKNLNSLNILKLVFNYNKQILIT